MAEAFYTASSSPGFSGTAPISSTPASSSTTGPPPPPPPPKPTSHLSPNQSRADTPVLSSPPTTSASAQAGQVNSPRPQPPIPTGQTASSTPGPHGQQVLQHAHVPVPPPSLADRWIPKQLEEKPISELHPLVNNPSLLASLATTHPAYASALVPLQTAIQANLQLAQQVAQLENQLRQLRDETAQLLLNHTSLQSQWRRKQSEMDDALSPWGPRQMYQRLVSSINEQEALLRAVQESFLEGSSDGGAPYSGGDGKASDKEVTEWVRRIREGATTLAKRQEMRARWDEGRVGGWR